ncbi:MAG: hypothetical protein ACYDA1_08070 [Vulcanimicrobiaceae bacterium]
MHVTYADAYDLLVEHGTNESRKKFSEWEARPDLCAAGVVSFVKSFCHEYLFEISREQFDEVSKLTAHPLGNVSPDVVADKEAIALVEDLDTPWSFMQLFHDYVETHRRLPTWQAFRSWLCGEAKERLWQPYQEMLDWKSLSSDQRKVVGRGIAWRLGNAYYSALREVDILISLRDADVQLSYHILADALYAVDFWSAAHLISVYIPNARYKDDGHGGRKARPDVIFRDSAFDYDDFAIRKQRVHGKYWPVSATTAVQIALFATGARPSKRANV